MWIKIVTTKVKVKGKRAKKVYRYVKVVQRWYLDSEGHKREVVVATLGTLDVVRASARTLIAGLEKLPAD